MPDGVAEPSTLERPSQICQPQLTWKPILAALLQGVKPVAGAPRLTKGRIPYCSGLEVEVFAVQGSEAREPFGDKAFAVEVKFRVLTIYQSSQASWEGKNHVLPAGMGCCQNYDPFLGTLKIRCRTIIGTQKGTIILTSSYICLRKPCTPLP